MRYNEKFRDIVHMEDITTFNCGGIEGLMKEYHIFEHERSQNLELHTGAFEVIQRLKHI